MNLARTLDALVERIETTTALDPVAERVAGLVRKVIPDGVVKDTASGTAIGHPLHPAVVAVPMGSWIAAGYLDLAGGPAARRSAQRLVGLGVLSALPAAATGGSDWLDTSGSERRVGLVHAGLNYTAIALYAGSWLARRRGRHGTGAALAVGGAGVLGAAGWLGGHLAYAMGVGVDTTAFQQFPKDWADVAADAEIREGASTAATADGVAVLLTREDGAVLAIADRCTHRGAPLHEGPIADGCVTCPWHGSVFELADGTVRRGPATRPQPALEVRINDGRVQVRRSTETRSLRTNPVGA